MDVPGLAQMADRGGDGGGIHNIGPYGGSAPSPEDRAKYFDAYGVPRMDDPGEVAASSGISLGQMASGFLPRYDPDVEGIGYSPGGDLGGFFNAADLFRKIGRDVPGMATHQMSAPSTNNWRLLGMGPGWIMRNGSLINALGGPVRFGGSSSHAYGVGLTAEQGMGVRDASYLGSGASRGMPNRWGDSFYWPGAATGGFADRYPSGTNV